MDPSRALPFAADGGGLTIPLALLGPGTMVLMSVPDDSIVPLAAEGDWVVVRQQASMEDDLPVVAMLAGDHVICRPGQVPHGATIVGVVIWVLGQPAVEPSPVP